MRFKILGMLGVIMMSPTVMAAQCGSSTYDPVTQGCYTLTSNESILFDVHFKYTVHEKLHKIQGLPSQGSISDSGGNQLLENLFNAVVNNGLKEEYEVRFTPQGELFPGTCSFKAGTNEEIQHVEGNMIDLTIVPKGNSCEVQPKVTPMSSQFLERVCGNQLVTGTDSAWCIAMHNLDTKHGYAVEKSRMMQTQGNLYVVIPEIFGSWIVDLQNIDRTLDITSVNDLPTKHCRIETSKLDLKTHKDEKVNIHLDLYGNEYRCSLSYEKN